MGTRALPQADNWVHTYGTIDCGLELMRDAWQRLDQVFSVEKEHFSGKGSSTILYDGPQYGLHLLTKHPVDVLIVERGHASQGWDIPKAERWETLVSNVDSLLRPKVVIETWSAIAVTWDNGPTGKPCRTRWEDLGYSTRIKMIVATAVGGAINQKRLIVTQMNDALSKRNTIWNEEEDIFEEDRSVNVRPMSNLLTPDGLVKRDSWIKDDRPSIDSETSPMPPYQTWIRTARGIRRLQLDELARGLGTPKDKLENVAHKLSQILLQRTTSIFHWEYLSAGFAHHEGNSTSLSYNRNSRSTTTSTEVVTCETETPIFQWRPPSLQIGSRWHRQRLINLLIATSGYDDVYGKILQGLHMMDVHRQNYTCSHPEPKGLQILWWEFPPEHWDDLRDGSSMTFLSTPPSGLVPNGEMSKEQQVIAGEFVDELVSLKVLRETPVGSETLCNAPLHMLPKEGQPEQWRCIANLLEGGQNLVVGNDPVFLPRVSHILPQLYTGGYSAVVDASKFFYQFSTREKERKYLGTIHPITGVIYEYCGLPMGAGNSPALGGRYGLAFVRLLKAQCKSFQGQPRANCWWSGFEHDGTYDPKLGYGYILIGADGKPSLKIWVFVDDFLIHGPNYNVTAKALTWFLDLAVDVGLLCHPKKLTPPQQEVKYCGFLLNTTKIPRQIMPISKRERALAMVEYVFESPMDETFSRLALAVVVGVLELLVDGTPQLLSHTYLRHSHSLVHPPGIGTGALPYYTLTTIPTVASSR